MNNLNQNINSNILQYASNFNGAAGAFNGIGWQNTNKSPLYRIVQNNDLYPIDFLPASLSKLIQDLSHLTQLPYQVVAQTVLSAIALSCQGLINVKNDDQVTPTNEYFCTLLPSGVGKSQIDGLVFQTINDFQRKLNDKYKEDMKVFSEACDSWDVQKNLLMKKMYRAKSTTESEVLLIDFNKLQSRKPIKPNATRMVLEDVTKAETIRSLAEELPIKIIKTDEGELAVRQTLQDISMLNKLYSCSPLRVATKTAGSFELDFTRVSMHLMFQPGVFKQVCSSMDFKSIENGFLPRFLFVCPNLAPWKPTPNFIKERPISLEWFDKRILSLLEQTMALFMNSTAKPKNIDLSNDAKWVLHHFHIFNVESMPINDELHKFSPIVNRTAEHALRLAGLLHCFEYGTEGEISGPMMESCCALATWYKFQSFIVIDQLTKPDSDRDEEDLFNYCRYSGLKHQIPHNQVYNYLGTSYLQNYAYFLPSTLRRFGPNRLREKRRFDRTVKNLIDYGLASSWNSQKPTIIGIRTDIR